MLKIELPLRVGDSFALMWSGSPIDVIVDAVNVEDAPNMIVLSLHEATTAELEEMHDDSDFEVPPDPWIAFVRGQSGERF